LLQIQYTVQYLINVTCSLCCKCVAEPWATACYQQIKTFPKNCRAPWLGNEKTLGSRSS